MATKGIVWRTTPREQHRILSESETWKQLFVDEMRKRGATGRQLGDAWATIEEYCVEAQQSAVDAFGDPIGYAERLMPVPRRWRFLLQWLPMMVGAITLFMAAFMPDVWRSPMAVNWGSLVLPLLFLVFLVLSYVLWPGLKRRTAPGLIGWFIVMFGLQIAAIELRNWTAHALTCPGWALWALFAVLSLTNIGLVRTAVNDRMVDPVNGSRAPGWAWTALWLLGPLVPAMVVALRVL